MTLADFLAATGRTDAVFAAELGVSAETVRLWRIGKHIPQPPVMAKIRSLTMDIVKPQDFYPREPAAAE